MIGTTVIEQQLRTALAAENVEVTDESAQHAGHAGARNGGGHYAVTVVSPQFAGKNPVERHRMVYAALGNAMREQIHALSIRAFTPEEI
ncbi:MAG: BolA family protein [Acidiferrobacterales bacterium]